MEGLGRRQHWRERVLHLSLCPEESPTAMGGSSQGAARFFERTLRSRFYATHELLTAPLQFRSPARSAGLIESKPRRLWFLQPGWILVRSQTIRLRCRSLTRTRVIFRIV